MFPDKEKSIEPAIEMFVTIEKICGKDCEYYGEHEEALETPTRSESAGAARRRRLPSFLPE